MAKRAGPVAPSTAKEALDIRQGRDETTERAAARSILAPAFRHAVAASQILKPQYGSIPGKPGYGDYADEISATGDAAERGELAFASRLLAAQAVTLDNVFTEMTRRMALNMGEYLGATETYARVAMKAQAQCRATLETLAKLHQPREQTVRHVHVNDGGQAVIADEFHNHPGAEINEESSKRSVATGAAGQCATLPSPDPLGYGVPIPGSERQAAMQDAWRDESGRA